MSSNLASATGISLAPPHSLFNCVIQSGAAMVAPAPDLFEMAVASAFSKSTNAMLSMSSSFHASSNAEEEELVSVVSVVARALIAIEIRFPRLLFLLDAADEKSAQRTPPFPLSRQTEEEDDDDNFTAPREETEDVCIIIIIIIDVCSLYIFCDDISSPLLFYPKLLELEKKGNKKASQTRRRESSTIFKNRKGVIYLKRAARE